MFAKLMTGALYTTLIGGAMLFHEGAIKVDVQEKREGGDHVFVIAPATILTWGVNLVPQDKLPRLPRQAREALPAIQAGAAELERLPDFILVDVQERDEHVKVQKIGGNLVVDVDSPRETVHVSVPLRAARKAIEDFVARAPQGDSFDHSHGKAQRADW